MDKLNQESIEKGDKVGHPFHGNQHSSGKKYSDAQGAASSASVRAKRKSDSANMDGTPFAHLSAARSHAVARTAHLLAAKQSATAETHSFHVQQSNRHLIDNLYHKQKSSKRGYLEGVKASLKPDAKIKAETKKEWAARVKANLPKSVAAINARIDAKKSDDVEDLEKSDSDLELLYKGDKEGHPFRGNKWVKIPAGWHKPNSKVDPKIVARLRLHGTPPSWTNVVLHKDPNNNMQSQGLDSKGRPQQRYNMAVQKKIRDEKKWSKLAKLNKEKAGLDKKFQSDMNDKKLSTIERDNAAVSLLISRSGFRIGSDKSTLADKKAYGASNMRAHMVSISGDTMSFNFTGKKGVLQNHNVTDKDLAKHIATRKAAMIKAKDKGRIFTTNETLVAKYVKKVSGDKFTPKDFRTWNANALAAYTINKMPKPKTASELKKARTSVAEIVSSKLGNQPSEALKSYINPAVFEQWEKGVK